MKRIKEIFLKNSSKIRLFSAKDEYIFLSKKEKRPKLEEENKRAYTKEYFSTLYIMIMILLPKEPHLK